MLATCSARPNSPSGDWSSGKRRAVVLVCCSSRAMASPCWQSEASAPRLLLGGGVAAEPEDLGWAEQAKPIAADNISPRTSAFSIPPPDRPIGTLQRSRSRRKRRDRRLGLRDHGRGGHPRLA